MKFPAEWVREDCGGVGYKLGVFLRLSPVSSSISSPHPPTLTTLPTLLPALPRTLPPPPPPILLLLFSPNSSTSTSTPPAPLLPSLFLQLVYFHFDSSFDSSDSSTSTSTPRFLYFGWPQPFHFNWSESRAPCIFTASPLSNICSLALRHHHSPTPIHPEHTSRLHLFSSFGSTAS